VYPLHDRQPTVELHRDAIEPSFVTTRLNLADGCWIVDAEARVAADTAAFARRQQAGGNQRPLELRLRPAPAART
jgi:hypothetical protein